MKGALVLNGEKFNGKIIADLVVCADGGYNKCEVKADYIIGDMDSISVSALPENCILLNPIKDETDGEYALNFLIKKGCKEIDVYGLDGGRLDHILGNIALLAQGVDLGIKICAYCNGFTAYMVNNDINLSVNKNDIVSLVPFTDMVHIMYTKGLYYPLSDQTLFKNSCLSLSNLAIESKISIGIRHNSGKCLIIINKVKEGSV